MTGVRRMLALVLAVPFLVALATGASAAPSGLIVYTSANCSTGGNATSIAIPASLGALGYPASSTVRLQAIDTVSKESFDTSLIADVNGNVCARIDVARATTWDFILSVGNDASTKRVVVTGNSPTTVAPATTTTAPSTVTTTVASTATPTTTPSTSTTTTVAPTPTTTALPPIAFSVTQLAVTPLLPGLPPSGLRLPTGLLAVGATLVVIGLLARRTSRGHPLEA